MKPLLIALLLITTWSASLAHAEGPIESFVGGVLEGVGKKIGEGLVDSPAPSEHAQVQTARTPLASPPAPRVLEIDGTGLPAEIVDGDRKYIFRGCERVTHTIRSYEPEKKYAEDLKWKWLDAPLFGSCFTVLSEPLPKPGENYQPETPSFEGRFLICSVEILNTTDEPVKHMVSGHRMEYVGDKGINGCLGVAYDTRDYLPASQREVPAQSPDTSIDHIYEFNLLPDRPLHLRGISFDGGGADAASSAVWALSMQVRHDPQTGQRTILKYPIKVPVADQTGSR